MLAISMPGLQEWLVIGIVVVLIFGRRLPEVGRNLGRGFVEFKKGLRGVEDDVKDSVGDVKGVGDEVKRIESDSRKT